MPISLHSGIMVLKCITFILVPSQMCMTLQREICRRKIIPKSRMPPLNCGLVSKTLHLTDAKEDLFFNGILLGWLALQLSAAIF